MGSGDGQAPPGPWSEAQASSVLQAAFPTPGGLREAPSSATWEQEDNGLVKSKKD